jgi:hypothetical protein
LKNLNNNLPRWIVNWIAEYLNNRFQRVHTSNSTSEWKQVKASVIQGSVIGQTLFILFLSDLHSELPPEIKAPKYADDILAYSIFDSTNNNKQNKIQETVDIIYNWTIKTNKNYKCQQI